MEKFPISPARDNLSPLIFTLTKREKFLNFSFFFQTFTRDNFNIKSLKKSAGALSFSVVVIMTLCVGGLQSYAILFTQLKQVIEVRTVY